MSFPLVLHTDDTPAGLEWAKMVGITQRMNPSINISEGSRQAGNSLVLAAYLYTTVPYWPEGSVFLSVPGTWLETDYATGDAVAVKLANGSLIVSPDDGTATLCAANMGIAEIRKIDLSAYRQDPYGLVRVAAQLSGGAALETVGTQAAPADIFLFPIPKAHIEEGLAEGEVFMVLRTFGNLTFTIGTDEFENTGIRNGDAVHVTFTKVSEGAATPEVLWASDCTFQKSFGYVPEGAPVIFNGSSGYLDIGLNKLSFAAECLPEILTAKNPSDYKVRIQKIGG